MGLEFVESVRTVDLAPDESTSVFFWDLDGAECRRAIVQVVHGSSEHASRYAGFAEALCVAGYCVAGSDHRGHGRIAKAKGRLGEPGRHGWNQIVHDLHRVSRLVRERNGDLPLVLVGHSMGTLLVREYAQRWGEELAGIVLSSPTAPIPNVDHAIQLMRSTVDELGAESASLGFDDSLRRYNAPFEPAATNWEWLSRDSEEVRKFDSDSLCGFPESNGFMLEFMEAERELRSPSSRSRIPRGLPILILAGDADPAVDYGRAAEELAKELDRDGFRRVGLKRYRDARHQLLFERNRQSIFADIAEWLDQTT